MTEKIELSAAFNITDSKRQHYDGKTYDYKIRISEEADAVHNTLNDINMSEEDFIDFVESYESHLLILLEGCYIFNVNSQSYRIIALHGCKDEMDIYDMIMWMMAKNDEFDLQYIFKDIQINKKLWNRIIGL